MMNIETCPAKKNIRYCLAEIVACNLSLSLSVYSHINCAYMYCVYGVYGDSVIDIHLAVFVCLYWLRA